MAALETAWSALPAAPGGAVNKRPPAATTPIPRSSLPATNANAGVAPPGAAGTAIPLRPRLGTNDIVAGQLMTFRALLTTYAKAQLPKIGTNVTHVAGGVVFPPDWETRASVPILVVCSPSGAPAIPSMRAYTNVAMAEGWLVLAADGPRLQVDRDTVFWNWAAVESVLGYLHLMVPKSRNWPLAVGGFSGGGKRAPCVAAAAMAGKENLIGVFMGGCNEERASVGALLFPAGPRFLTTPMMLSNGLSDPIAEAGYGVAIKAAMERAGFRNVRTRSYAGGHSLHEEDLRESLRWFEGGKK